jgi:microcompartment protein CcmK/EutM
LNDGRNVQDAVDAPVAGAGKTVPVLITGGSVQRSGAVLGCEVGMAGELADVPMSPAGGRRRTDRCRGAPAGAADAVDQIGKFGVGDLDLLSMTVSSRISSDASHRRVLPTTSRGRTA